MSSAWITVRVFISSTFRDMQAERDWLVRFVFPKLREELIKHGIHLVDVDLRWGVTSDQNALGVCREVIDQCHPRFMCILGGRYGWVPPGSAKSITADEVHYGVLDRTAEKRGYSFFYFRKDEATLAIPEEEARLGGYREFAQQDDIDSHGSEQAETMARERAGKLAALKQAIIDEGLPVHPYDAAWSAAEKRLIGLEAFGDRVYNNLLTNLKDDPDLASHFTPEGTAPPDEFAEEAEQMEAFIEERTDHYITGSREPLMNEMIAFAAADGMPNTFVLTGDPGSGKSALLAKFCRELASHLSTLNPQHSTVLPHFIGASTGSTDLRRTLRRLCHELAKATGNTEPLPLDIKELITHFQKLLAAAKQRVILVFDALNQFDATEGAHWLNWLPHKLPPCVCIVASVIAPEDGQPEHQTLTILRARPGSRIEKLAPLTEADTLAIIEGYLRRYSKRLSKEQIAALQEKQEGRLPLYLLTALEELRTLGTYHEITDRIRELPGEACTLFGWILTERLALDPGFRDGGGRPCGASLVEKFAACLGVSRHGLSPAELTALLDPGDPLGNVAALLRLLRPYLLRRSELLDFYHGQFREAAGAAHLDTPEKQRAAHQSVATCLKAFADPHRDGQCRDATPHALSELPHHQTRAEAWPDLIATLENIFFLEAKVSHDLAFDLAEDFTTAVDALPVERVERKRLRLLEEALRRDIHFITRHPAALFQCMWNTCWWYDCSEARQHYVDGLGPSGQLEQKLCDLLQGWRIQKERASLSFGWLRSLRPPPVHLGTAQRAVLCGHFGGVTSAAFSPDGHRIVSASDDATVRLWDGQSGAELAALHGHKDAVTSVAFSPDGRFIVSGSFDSTVRLWDAQSGGELIVFRGHVDKVSSVAFSPDGRRIFSGSWDKTVRAWDAQSGMRIALFDAIESQVISLALSSDGRRIVVGTWVNTARLWDAETGAKLAVLQGHEGPVNCVAFSPDGRLILTGGKDTTVRLWDAQSGEALAVFQGHGGEVCSVAFSRDGRRFLSGSGDSAFSNGTATVPMWGAPITIDVPANLPRGDMTVRLWDAQTGAEISAFHGHEQAVSSVTFSPDGKRLLTGSQDCTIRLWDGDGSKLTPLGGHQGEVKGLVFSPDGRRLLSRARNPDLAVRLWDTRDGTIRAVLHGHEWVISMAFSPDGERVLTGSLDGSVRLWDSQNGKELSVLLGHEIGEMSVAFSPDGKRILTRSSDGTARAWDAQSSECIEVSPRNGPVGMTANESNDCPLRLLAHGLDTVLIETSTIQQIAWLPMNLWWITSHPCERLWAGTLNTYLALFQLEIRNEQYEEQLRAGLDKCLRELGESHDQTQAHFAALVGHLQRVGSPDGVRQLIEDRNRRNSLSKLAALRESAGQNFAKGYWEAAAMELEKLVEWGEPLKELAPKIVTCLLNAHEDLMAHDAAKIEDLLRRLESAGHTVFAVDLRRQFEAKQPKPKRQWWKLW